MIGPQSFQETAIDYLTVLATPRAAVETWGCMPSTKLQSPPCSGDRDIVSWALVRIFQKVGPRPGSGPSSSQNTDEPTGKGVRVGLLKGKAPCKDTGIERHWE